MRTPARKDPRACAAPAPPRSLRAPAGHAHRGAAPRSVRGACADSGREGSGAAMSAAEPSGGGMRFAERQLRRHGWTRGERRPDRPSRARGARLKGPSVRRPRVGEAGGRHRAAHPPERQMRHRGGERGHEAPQPPSLHRPPPLPSPSHPSPASPPYLPLLLPPPIPSHPPRPPPPPHSPLLPPPTRSPHPPSPPFSPHLFPFFLHLPPIFLLPPLFLHFPPPHPFPPPFSSSSPSPTHIPLFPPSLPPSFLSPPPSSPPFPSHRRPSSPSFPPTPHRWGTTRPSSSRSIGGTTSSMRRRPTLLCGMSRYGGGEGEGGSLHVLQAAPGALRAPPAPQCYAELPSAICSPSITSQCCLQTLNVLPLPPSAICSPSVHPCCHPCPPVLP